MSIPHCARGPSRCEKCKATAQEKKIYLLKIYLQPGEVARPVIEVKRDGESHYYEYDAIKQFNTEAEAKEYAEKHNISDISL